MESPCLSCMMWLWISNASRCYAASDNAFKGTLGRELLCHPDSYGVVLPDPDPVQALAVSAST